MSEETFAYVDDQIVDAVVEHLREQVPAVEGRVYAVSTAEGDDGWSGRDYPFMIVASGETAVDLISGPDGALEENATDILVSIHDLETEGTPVHLRLSDMVVRVVRAVHRLPFEAVLDVVRRSVTEVLDVADQANGARSARTVTFTVTYLTEPGVVDRFVPPGHL